MKKKKERESESKGLVMRFRVIFLISRCQKENCQKSKLIEEFQKLVLLVKGQLYIPCFKNQNPFKAKSQLYLK